MTLTSSASGVGPTVLFYNVAANAGAARSGTLVVAGQSVTIAQSAPLPTMTLDKSSLVFRGRHQRAASLRSPRRRSSG